VMRGRRHFSNREGNKGVSGGEKGKRRKAYLVRDGRPSFLRAEEDFISPLRGREKESREMGKKGGQYFS